MTENEEFPGMSWDEVRHLGNEHNVWLIPEMISNTSTLLYGESESGKSFLAAALTASLTTAAPFLGREVIGGPYRVAVGWTDDSGHIEYQERIASATHDVSDPGVHFFHLPVMRTPGMWDALLTGLRANDCNVLILDNMSQAADGDLDKNQPSREFFAGVRKIVEAGIAVVVVAHSSGKNHGNGKSDQPLGHSSIVGAVRWRVFVKRLPQDHIKLTFQGNHARKHDLTVKHGDGANFQIIDSNTADERLEKERKRETDTLDEYGEIALWVYRNCQGMGVNKTVAALVEKFGKSERTYKDQLSKGKLAGMLIRQGTAAKTTWTLRDNVRI